MKLYNRGWNGINFLKLGARLYAQFTDSKTPFIPQDSINSWYFYKPRNAGNSLGSGGSGSIKKFGGSFAKRQAALEEQYFLKRQQKLIQRLRDRIKARRKKGNRRLPRGERNDNFKELE